MVANSDDDRLESLRSALEVAGRLAHTLNENELLMRLMNLFARMPEGDRETIVGVLEREVQTRVVSQAVADDLTKIALRPNPNARLYLRVIDPQGAADEPDMLAFLRALWSVHRSITTLDSAWRNMITMAIRQMDQDARDRLLEFNQAVRAMIDDANRAGA